MKLQSEALAVKQTQLKEEKKKIGTEAFCLLTPCTNG
jgi:hypothetical protein